MTLPELMLTGLLGMMLAGVAADCLVAGVRLGPRLAHAGERQRARVALWRLADDLVRAGGVGRTGKPPGLPDGVTETPDLFIQGKVVPLQDPVDVAGCMVFRVPVTGADMASASWTLTSLSGSVDDVAGSIEGGRFFAPVSGPQADSLHLPSLLAVQRVRVRWFMREEKLWREENGRMAEMAENVRRFSVTIRQNGRLADIVLDDWCLTVAMARHAG
ncbi:hypothetical protein [Paludibacterium paludis]|uniref:Uncharacterized protein n=1 Tax=Paludibacterium paludis TaxID=1225769 RepID=A0A918P4I7_9NEIS|nr:hypothetical protein [Paludibacterium paludis]GGY16778.1 hypothetical protein GCM10011289_20230 [Paludibacterium paludis]